jgi:hypothetical protein
MHSRFVLSIYLFLFLIPSVGACPPAQTRDFPTGITPRLGSPRLTKQAEMPCHHLATLRRARCCSNRDSVPRPADLVLRSRVVLDRWSWTSALADRVGGEAYSFVLGMVGDREHIASPAWTTSRPLGATLRSSTIRAAGRR